MKNFIIKYKYFFLGLFFILIFSFLYIFLNFGDNNITQKSNSLSIITGSGLDTNAAEKIISSETITIDPNIYDSLGEFLYYFNTGTGILHDVDLLNEDFYIKVYNGDSFVVTKFSKDLILHIDTLGNKNIKNQAIQDIFNFYKTENYIYGEPNDKRSGIKLLSDSELPPNMQFHNSLLLPYSGETSLEILKRLENNKNRTFEESQQLSYVYDFFGDYDKSEKLRKQIGLNKIKYTITGKVNSLGNFVKGAQVEVLNYDNVKTYTDDKGNYKLEFDTYPMSRLRLKASLSEFSDAYNGVYVVFDYDNQSSQDVNFILQKPDTKVLIKSSELDGGKSKLLSSSIGNTFEFKKGVLLDSNGKVYNGDFNVYIYEFNRNTLGMDNYLTLDNFDSLYGYTGDMMITNGMTYLLVYDIDGNELYISKNNPIVTRQKVDIDYLLNNNVNGTDLLTKEQINLILEESKLDGYPVDREFLLTRGITGFSPWWVLNIKKGIWENNGIKLLNKDGLKESLYYNVD